MGRKIQIKEPNILTDRSMNLKIFLIPLLLAVMVLFTYRKTFNNDFVDWDDYTYVVDNGLVRHPEATTIKDVFTTDVSLNYHPLTILSLRLNNNKCSQCPEGISAAPFIRWNIIIHILNSILVFILAYFLSKKKILVAFITSALFAVHPMHVESVAWISERKDVLYSFFFLSGLITYIKYLESKQDKLRRIMLYIVTLVLFLLSCLSKAMAVVFPLVLILIRYWMHEPAEKSDFRESLKYIFSSRFLVSLLPFFILSLLFGLLAVTINNLNSFTLWHRLQYTSYGFIMYIVKFFVPVNQVAIYPYPTPAEIASGSIGSILKAAPFLFIIFWAIVFYSLRKTRLIFFGIGFYFLTVMMVLQFISVGVAIMADRYTYLPYIGLAFIPAMMVGNSLEKKRIPAFVVSGIFILIMIILSVRQTEVWSNSETLWTPVIRLYPTLETPRGIRGIYYDKMAKRAKDTKQQKLYEDKAATDYMVAINSGTNRADVFEGAGCILGKRGDLDNALLCLNRSIQLNPQKGSAYFNRGITFGLLDKNQEAIKDYTIALKYSPQDSVEIITNRSNLLMSSGRFSEAISDFTYLLSTDRQNFIFYSNRALAREQTKDLAGAIFDCLNALKLQPNDEISKAQLQRLIKK